MPKNSEKHKSLISSRKTGVVLIVAGVILGLLAVGLFIYDNYAGPKLPSDPSTSRSGPSSARPSHAEIASYEVPPKNPKYINIPSIGVPTSRIIELGVTKSNQIAVPNNIYDAGWYDQSSKPGQPGAMFIYGHVSSWTADGLFYNLKKLKSGDKVMITRGDNKKFIYQVVKSKIYDYKKVDMQAALSPVQTGTPGLNLMTCTGHVIKGTSEFNERLVVFTRLVSS